MQNGHSVLNNNHCKTE
uniref:Uncharacterized protein n=2 Tax=Anguilla TaxID=7935 RepID=A0A0E9PMZ9_ANGAN